METKQLIKKFHKFCGGRHCFSYSSWPSFDWFKSHSSCLNHSSQSAKFLKTDVIILSNVFETFRSTYLKHYGLDPAHLYTSPGLASLSEEDRR